ncbi:unnamed protein product, partial [Ectocarpus sp. 12 AP-2014]
VQQIESSLKSFGCVCLPVSDLDGIDENRGSDGASSLNSRMTGAVRRVVEMVAVSKGWMSVDIHKNGRAISCNRIVATDCKLNTQLLAHLLSACTRTFPFFSRVCRHHVESTLSCLYVTHDGR